VAPLLGRDRPRLGASVGESCAPCGSKDPEPRHKNCRMNKTLRGCLSGGIAAVFALVCVDAAAEPEELTESALCVPDCRAGFLCVDGACVSLCNPPCRDDERCTAEAECVPRVATPDPESHPSPPPPSTAQSPELDAVPSPPPAPMEGNRWFLSGGGHFIDFYGGNVTVHRGFDGGDGRYRLLGGRVAGGVYDDYGYLYLAVDAGLRHVVAGPDAYSPTFFLTGGLGHMREFGDFSTYTYLVPHARFGGGVLWGEPGRSYFGLEIVGAMGYAVEYGYGSDDSHFTGSLETNLTITF
jgi:hypothetical protein